jgi:hypothetical protein
VPSARDLTPNWATRPAYQTFTVTAPTTTANTYNLLASDRRCVGKNAAQQLVLVSRTSVEAMDFGVRSTSAKC